MSDPRPFLGMDRHLRLLIVVSAFTLLVLSVSLSTTVLDLARNSHVGLHLMPPLLALATSMLLAPPCGEPPRPKQWALCLCLAALVGTLATVFAPEAHEHWRRSDADVLYPEWSVAVQAGHFPALLWTVGLHALVPVPWLLVRRHRPNLEWQCTGALASGLLVLWALLSDQLLGGVLDRLAGVFPFVILGAGSYCADRWVDGPALRPPTPDTARKVLILALGSSICAGAALHVGADLTVRGFGEPETNASVERALVDCALSLRTYEDQHGVLPACLGELPDADRELMLGLKDGYIIRYGRSQKGWSLAADPLPEVGARRAFYRLRPGEPLESRARAPYGLTVW